jgi:hypothetical protein
MMIIKRLPLLIAGGIGYVLGAKAGRERYEQLTAAYDKVRNDPRVQEKAEQAADFAKEKAPVVKDKVTEAAGAATEKVKSATSGSGDVGDQLNPDSLHFQDDGGPKGDLP